MYQGWGLEVYIRPGWVVIRPTLRSGYRRRLCRRCGGQSWRKISRCFVLFSAVVLQCLAVLERPGSATAAPYVARHRAQHTASVIGNHTRSPLITPDPVQKPPRNPPEPTPEPSQTQQTRDRHPTDTRQTPDRLESGSIPIRFWLILVGGLEMY